ncbi:MAG: hypothetical protein AB7E47_03815 [Desulfovibrionaceae bacterium]
MTAAAATATRGLEIHDASGRSVGAFTFDGGESRRVQGAGLAVLEGEDA